MQDSTSLQVADAVHPGDEMYRSDPDRYFTLGAQALDLIRIALEASEHGKPRSILDLPCGHGRVLRYLRAEYPDATIAACDLDREGVDFCAEQFDAVPVYSHENPEHLELPRADLIWCGSLLTHLAPDRIPGFLRVLREALAGVLVFTVHGERLTGLLRERKLTYGISDDDARRVIDDYREQGVGFASYSDDSGYGTTLASPAWVSKQLEPLQVSLVLYREYGWGNQDVVAVQPRPDW